MSEERIVAAMRLMWERAKLLIEPSSAVAVAAVLSDEFRGLDGLHGRDDISESRRSKAVFFNFVFNFVARVAGNE